MTGAQAAGLPTREADSAAASAVKAMQAEGRHAEARERYAELVARHQRRATRIAFHYVRDSAEADEAVQDALVKAYSHLSSFREELPFEVWFMRILINGCLTDRRDAPRAVAEDVRVAGRTATSRSAWRAGPSPEDQLPAQCANWHGAGPASERQRSFHVEPLSGLHVARGQRHDWINESTVRVHLFRAIRRLRRSPRMARVSGWGEKCRHF
jgi:RNA polymerase sigma-70 factor (ECF subfamily)